MTEYRIRTMNRQDADTAISWAAAEGWNPGPYDAESFFLADPNGFFIGELDGEPIGCISAVAYDSTFGFIGLYMVKPEFRTHNYGIPLGKRALEYLGNRNIGLDGVFKQRDNYEKFGFTYAYSNIRYEGLIKGKLSPNVTPASQLPFEIILNYDTACFPVPRPAFLKSWLTLPNGISLAYLDGNELKGYGTIRSCAAGHKIGPLFADQADVAEEIFLSLCSHSGEGPIYLDVPEVNQTGQELVKKYGMKKVFGTARMYNKEEPQIALKKIIGVTTFELG